MRLDPTFLKRMTIPQKSVFKWKNGSHSLKKALESRKYATFPTIISIQKHKRSFLVSRKVNGKTLLSS
jgi:hypothetical protein